MRVCKSVNLLLLAVALSSFGTISAWNGPAMEGVAVSQQKKKVTGIVEDEFGSIAGAAIVVKGTTTGGITDMNGEFSIDVSNGETLVVSFLGYITQEIKYSGQEHLAIKLVEDSQALEEVVVTALGIKRDAKKLGYAISTLNASELTKTASPNLGSALYGKAAGVRVQTAPGGATGSISINVRGISSITGSNQPLIVVDGVPIRNGDANKDGYWTDQRVNSNGLADINPEDIENLSILKGASASALYGSEAANGVVMITTKSGKSVQGFGVEVGASLVGDFVAYMPEYQTTYGPGRPVAFWNPRGADENGFVQRTDRNGNTYRSVDNTEMYQYFGPKYDGGDVLYYDGTLRKYSVINENPYKEIFRTGVSQQYNVAITNGTEKGNLRLSYTYLDNQPTQYNSSFKKHNFNLTGSHKVSEKIRVDYSANYMIQDIKNRPYRISRLVTNFNGMAGAFDDVKWMKDNTITSLGYMNTLYTNDRHLTPDEGYEYNFGARNLMDEYFWHILAKQQLETSNRLIANITPSWEIIDGLTLRGRIATDYTTDKIENKEPNQYSLLLTSEDQSAGGSYALQNKRYEIFFGDVMLTYFKNLTDKIDLNAMVGWQARSESAYNATVRTSRGLSVDHWYHLNASRSTKETDMYKSEYLKTAFLGTLGLSYDNWVFLEGTGRQEKTSTLAKGNNSFFYPSVNASFVYTELMKDKKPTWYDYGKFRASYGIVGNAPEIYRATQAYTQNSASGYIYNTVDLALGNETIEPETKYEWEFGLESKFFRNRLGFDASFYTNTVKDQILQTTMPVSSGGRSILMNIGELKNKGFELAVYGTPIRTKDWNWDVRANISWYKNEVTKLADGIDRISHIDGGYDGGAAYLYSEVGRPMGDIYAYAPAEDEYGNKIIAANGLYKRTDEPVRVGNAMPKLTGGFATSVSYKDFFVDASLDFRIGGAVLSQPYLFLMHTGQIEESMKWRENELTYYLDANNECVPWTGSVGPNGEKVYDNGIILEGIKEDGTPNDKMIGGDSYYNHSYGWGTGNPNRFYSHGVFDNSYVKVREISFGYNLPSALLSKFLCKSMQVSVYTRNPFYIYKNMPAFDAEAADGTTWITQASIGGSTATTRSFGVTLRASF